MKLFAVAGMSLAVLCCASPSFANNDPSDQASALGAQAVLYSAATPVLLGGSAAYTSAGASDGLVRIVDTAGQGLSELTATVFDIAVDALVYDPKEVRVTANKKDIPLVIRRDYLELNEKVKVDEK